jgi:hypothetical protein
VQISTCLLEFNITSLAQPPLGFTLAQDFEGYQARALEKDEIVPAGTEKSMHYPYVIQLRRSYHTEVKFMRKRGPVGTPFSHSLLLTSFTQNETVSFLVKGF